MKRIVIIILILFLFVIVKECYHIYIKKDKNMSINGNQANIIEKNVLVPNNIFISEFENANNKNQNKIDDWRIVLVNYENLLPEDFEVELAYIDKTRKFDARAIAELKQMLKDMKNQGITNVWVQSSYRDVKYQENLFNDKINVYMNQGKTREEAEQLTLRLINKPRTSEHNLGLAVDFNYVDYSFDTTKGFYWLQENAENYGFILRYKKEKEDITKVDYEPWHWRYVGVEHAKKINELDLCLEEYIEYINK